MFLISFFIIILLMEVSLWILDAWEERKLRTQAGRVSEVGPEETQVLL